MSYVFGALAFYFLTSVYEYCKNIGKLKDRELVLMLNTSADHEEFLRKINSQRKKVRRGQEAIIMSYQLYWLDTKFQEMSINMGY